MGQRHKRMTQILGMEGWHVVDSHFETADGTVVEPLGRYDLFAQTRLVLVVARRWMGRCSQCFGPCPRVHERLPPRRWDDLPWAGHPVSLQYAPVRLKCSRCDTTAVELVAWADPKQRQSRRLQQQLALQAASMPISHVAALSGLHWSTVHRAEERALERWDRTRKPVALRYVGVDEKWLGRRHRLAHKFITIVSNLETGEPLWIGHGRSEETLAQWLATLSPCAKKQLVLFSMDMHRAFFNAVRADGELAHVQVVHDPFHVLKRAGEAVTELRRAAFFRADARMRALGRGTRWLVLRAWDKTTADQRADLRLLFHFNAQLARGYQIVEELRAVLRAPDRASMVVGLKRILRRTARRAVAPLRSLHESLRRHFEEIVALGEHHPPTGRTEALNNNWEALIRRGRGYRNYDDVLRKLRFMVANPIATKQGMERFNALGLPTPHPRAAA